MDNQQETTIQILFYMTIKPLQLKPGESIPQKVLDDLAKANEKYTKSRDVGVYIQNIETIFGLTPTPITHQHKFYLGGFVEGEGSVNVGAKKNSTSRFKIYLDPEFSVTQHANGIVNLYYLLCIFRTGRIRHKGGNNATMIFVIDNRVSLKEKVLPFYENFVLPFGSPAKKRRLFLFKQLLEHFENKLHLDYNGIVHIILPLYYEMRCQVGQKNQTFQSLQDAIDYVTDAHIEYHRKKGLP